MRQILLNQITPQQLQEIIANTVRAEIGALKNIVKTKVPNTLLTRYEAAERLKINKSTLHNWTKKNILKSYGIEGRVYYKSEEIEQALIKLN